MKKYLLLIFTSFLFYSCVSKKSEQEPNDHFTNATPLVPNGKIKGRIAIAGDIDVYKLNIQEESASLDLYIGGIRDIDFVLSIQDKDRQEMKRYDETAAGGDEEALDIGVVKGEYYIVLSNKNEKASNSKQEYVLVSKLEPSLGREMEPNDKALLANPLEPTGVIRGHYFPTHNLLAEDEEKTEQDWYRLNIDKEGSFILSIDLSEVPKVDPLFEIYDANFYKIKEIDNGGPGEPERLKDFGIKGPAQFLIRLRPKEKHSGNQDVPYMLLTELLPYEANTEFEPNDQRVDATLFDKNNITGHLSPTGDMDWYKVVVATDSRKILRAELTPLAGMDLILTLADELGNPILTVDNMGKEQPEVLTGFGAEDQEYYLFVSEKSGKAVNSRNAYTLTKTLSLFQEGLEFETNNASVTAQPIKVGSSVNGYISPKEDVDWYEFNVYKNGSVLFELTGVLNVRFGVTLFNQDSAEIAALSAKKAGESISFDKELEAGTYWLRIKTEDPGQGNVRDKYTLRLRMR